MSDDDSQVFKLPESIAQLVDLNRVIREFNVINESLNQEYIKDPTKTFRVRTSPKFSDLLTINDINILDKDQRATLLKVLDKIKTSAPTVNISFSAEASDEFVAKIVNWFRVNADPYCLLVVGLEPSIGVGSIVRTTNKVFDFSLKNRLKLTSKQLEDSIKQVNAVRVDK